MTNEVLSQASAAEVIAESQLLEVVSLWLEEGLDTFRASVIMSHPRSTAYPVFSLGTALRILREDLRDLGNVPVSRETLGASLGFQTASGGAAGRTIAGLVQFGLLDRRSSTFALSPLGRRLQSLPEDHAEYAPARAAACREPRLFRALLQRFGPEGRLPDDLGPYLEQLGIQRHALDSAARVFRESLLLAGLMGFDGVLKTNSPQRNELAAEGPASQGNAADFELLLVGGQRGVLRLPRTLHEVSLQELVVSLQRILDALPHHLGLTESTSLGNLLASAVPPPNESFRHFQLYLSQDEPSELVLPPLRSLEDLKRLEAVLFGLVGYLRPRLRATVGSSEEEAPADASLASVVWHRGTRV